MRATVVLCVLFTTAVFADRQCTSDQWKGDIGFVIAYAKGKSDSGRLMGSTQIYFDKTNQREAKYTKTYYKDRLVSHVAEVTLYQDGVGHIYKANLETQSCNIKVLQEPFYVPCIPEEAKHVSDYYLGLKGGLKVSDYRGQRHNNEYTVSVMGDGAYVMPVVSTVAGQKGDVKYSADFLYRNITHRLTDEHVFDIPAPCKIGKKVSVGTVNDADDFFLPPRSFF